MKAVISSQFAHQFHFFDDRFFKPNYKVLMSSDIEKKINEYLFHEFGIEGNESSVTDSWPFRLTKVVDIEGEAIYEFEANDGLFYAVFGKVLRYLKKDGTVDDLKLEFKGSSWFEERHPVNLDQSFGDHPRIPRAVERREHIEKLARKLGKKGDLKILEGLFLQDTGEYLALVQFGNDDFVHVIGDNFEKLDIPLKPISPSRILSRIIGTIVS